MESFKRETAKKCRVKHILEGSYIKKEGWEPNYIDTGDVRISRVNILGFVVSKEGPKEFLLDDSHRIRVRSFDQPFDHIKVGDMTLIIGRPKVYNEQKYILSEIVKIIKNKKWMEYRLLELDKEKSSNSEMPVVNTKIAIQKTEKDAHSPDKKPTENTKNNKPALLDKIRTLDQGDGVDIDVLINTLDIETPEKKINQLLEQGEVFEIRPGKIKVI